MGIARVIVNFSKSRLTDAEVSAQLAKVIAEMTGNTNFLEPVVSLVTAQEELDKFNDLSIAAKDGTRKDTAAKNAQRKVVESILKKLGNYVQLTSDGDETIILTSGFDLAKKAMPIGPLEQATGLSVKPGSNKGAVSLSCDIVDQASFYEFEYTSAPSTPESIWLKQTSTKRRMEIAGLTSGKQYAFRVAGAGTDLMRKWSEEVVSYIM